MDGSPQDAVPLTILTGFLGAGKTTLLNRILARDSGLRVAVLVNDFGTLNIDAELVVGVENDVISMANGCVCCTIRDDLAEAVRRVLDRPEEPEHILLEASGVADPAGIAMTFVDSELRKRIRLDSIVCVVDAEQVFGHPELPALLDLKLRQVGFSDLVVVNKVDLAGWEEVAKVRVWLDDHFRRLRVLEANYCEVPDEVLLGVGRFDAARASFESEMPAQVQADSPGDGNGHAGGHAAAFETWMYQTEQPLSLAALKEAMRTLPGTVYRAKGIVYTSDAPERRVVLQVVGRRADISVQDEWGQRPPRTQIVVIGATGTMNPSALQEIFASCIAAKPVGAS